MSQIMLFLSMSICFTVLAAIQALLDLFHSFTFLLCASNYWIPPLCGRQILLHTCYHTAHLLASTQLLQTVLSFDKFWHTLLPPRHWHFQ